MTKILFKEKQKFTQWWLWLLLLGIGFLPIYAIYNQIFLGNKFGDNPMSNLGLILFSLFIFFFIFFFYSLKLKTIISTNEISFRFIPFNSKKVKWKEIASIEVINYGFVGGWGIRYGTKYGTVYNVSGKKGLAIKLKNNKRFVIGTQKSIELEKVINEFYNNEEH